MTTAAIIRAEWNKFFASKKSHYCYCRRIRFRKYQRIESDLKSPGTDGRLYSRRWGFVKGYQSTDEWYSRIGYVGQEVFMFNGTVRDNVLFGATGYSDEDIYAALEMANAAEFVKEGVRGF